MIENCVLTSPSKQKISIQNPYEDFIYIPNEYGVYVLEYSLVDSLGNTSWYKKNIKVSDYELPTITIINQGKLEYVVGDTFEIPTYTTQDNVKVTQTSVYIKNSSSKTILINGEYVFTKSGTYTVFIRAIDSYGNLGYVSYQISVKEK